MTADVRIAESSEYKSFIHSSILILSSGKISCDTFLDDLSSLASTTLFPVTIRQLQIEILVKTSTDKQYFFIYLSVREINTYASLSPIFKRFIQLELAYYTHDLYKILILSKLLFSVNIKQPKKEYLEHFFQGC